MKRTIYLFALALVTLVSCEKDKDTTPEKKMGETKNAYVVASSKTAWNYYSLKEGKVIGTGEEDNTENAAWFARDDWDIAIRRYEVRTNSGAASSIAAQGGVYTCAEDLEFSSLEKVPNGATYVVDKIVTKHGHGGTTELIKSTAQVIFMKKDADGSLIMPPVYLPSPVYIFKTANGNNTYKVNFAQYKNADGESGHIKFDFAQLH